MAIKTIITCDFCKEELKYTSDIAFTITSVIVEIKLEMHFCTWQCMKKYLDENWA